MDTIPIKNSNLSVSVKCREGLNALTDGSCVCGFGSYQASDGSCIPCPIGQYKDSLFENECRKCSTSYPLSTTLKIGTVSVDDCICEPGYWLISTHEDNVEKKCSLCPDGVECSTYGVSQENVVLQKGYWRTSLNSSNVSPCESSTIACSGGNGTDLCADGYEGPYCSLCADGYSYSVFLGGCKQCDDKANVAKNMIVAVSLMILLVTTLGWKFMCKRSDINDRRNHSHEQLTTKLQKNKKTVDALIDDVGEFLTASSILWTKAKPVLVYLQYTNVMSFSYRVQFPKFLEKFLAYFSFLNLNMSNLIQLDCFLPKQYSNFYASLVFLTMIPLISIIGIVFYWSYSKYSSMNRMKDSFYQVKMDSFEKSLISFIVLLLYIIVAPAANTIFQISFCETLDNGVTLMQTDYSLTCGDKLYMFFFNYGLIMFGIYVIGIPLLFFIILYRLRKYLYKAGLSTSDNIQRRQSRYEKDVEPYYILFKVYKPECWWFDLIELVRRLAFSGGVYFILYYVLGSNSSILPLLSVIFCLGVCYVHIRLLNYYRPLLSSEDSILIEFIAWLTFADFLYGLWQLLEGEKQSQNLEQALSMIVEVMNLLLIPLAIILALHEGGYIQKYGANCVSICCNAKDSISNGIGNINMTSSKFTSKINENDVSDDTFYSLAFQRSQNKGRLSTIRGENPMIFLADIQSNNDKSEETVETIVPQTTIERRSSTSNSAPTNWNIAYDEDEVIYYYNTTTNEVTYEEPTSEVAPLEMELNIDESSSASWQTAYDEEGIPYYYNTTTNEVTYEEPTLEVAPLEMQSNIDDSSSACWQTAIDEEGMPYYHNIKSGEVQWDKPNSF